MEHTLALIERSHQGDKEARDTIFKENVGQNLLGLALIGVIATIFDKNFSKDSRITMMFMVFGSTY